MPPIANAQAQGTQSYSTRARTNINTSSCPTLSLKNNETARVLNGSGRPDIDVSSAGACQPTNTSFDVMIEYAGSPDYEGPNGYQEAERHDDGFHVILPSLHFKSLAVQAVPRSGEHAAARVHHALGQKEEKAGISGAGF
jgi:hypothetical protein